MEYELPYYVSNGGDGSANVHLCETLEQAEREDEEQPEGWGESSAGVVRLRLEDGKLQCRVYKTGEGLIWVNVPVKESK